MRHAQQAQRTVEAGGGAQRGHQLLHALGLVQQRAQVLLEGGARQARPAGARVGRAEQKAGEQASGCRELGGDATAVAGKQRSSAQR